MDTNGLLYKINRIRKDSTVRNGALFSFFSFLNKGISFILLTIIARFLAPDSYGIINLFNTNISIFAILICLNTSGLISINFFKKSTEEFKRTISTVLLLALIGFLFLSLIVFILGVLCNGAFGISAYYQWLSLWVCLFTLISNINLDIWRIEEKVVSYGIYSTIISLLNFGLTVLFVVVIKKDWEGRVYAHILSYLIAFGFSLIFLIKRKFITNIFPTRESIKECLRFGVPLMPHDASTWIRQGLDNLYINSFHSSALVGIFGFSSNFANIIHIIGQAFNNTNSVYIYKNLASDDDSVKTRLRRQTRLMILFYVVISISVGLASAAFIFYFFPNYHDSIKYLPLLCLSGFFRCIYFQFVNFIFYFGKTKGLMYISFGFSVLHTLLSFCLTRYSLFYTAIISAFIDLLITSSVFLYSRKIYKLF